jgi:hypothetical protein
MTFFQFKSFSFFNLVINRIVKYIKANAKGLCFFVNLTNATFWKNIPRGQEILEFFNGMTQQQIIQFFGCFDIFVVGFHNGINAYVAMTANPSSRNFEKTLWVSISKGYNRFTERCSGRATPSIEGDLRSSIGSSPVHPAGYSAASDFQGSSVESAFQQGLSTFGPFQGFEGQASAQPFSPFQCVGGPARQPVSPFQGFGGPVSGFSLFSAQPSSLGGHFLPIVQGSSTDPFILQNNFIPVQPTDEPISRKRQTRLEIIKGRIVSVEIPSGCSSGPSTSSTVGKKSPKAPTPIATTIANLEKKIARLERENPSEGSLNYSDLRFAKAKLEKIRNSL